MKNKNSNYAIYFCGISKNCHKNIEINLKFLDAFSKNFKHPTKVIVVDSDSNDGTKDVIEKFKNKNNFIIYELDGLEDIYSNRIKRIAVSRNKCLEIIAKLNNEKKIIYIPLDLDLDLFKFVSIQKLNDLIDYSINKNIPYGIFPFSTPYYYDIFALRADNWVEYNSQLRIKKLKNIFFIGSFFLNYLFIFRHQIDLQKFNNSKFNIVSAFGGMGIYNLNSSLIEKYYKLSKKDPELVSEHVLFNINFNLEIIEDWNIPAPYEHLEFKLLGIKNKIIYFLKTLYFDLVNKK